MIDDITASLQRRGFYAGKVDLDAAGVQVWAVMEELGEVARMLRRHAQGVNGLNTTKLTTEAADVVIAAVCLLAQCAGEDASTVVADKLARDELRGWRHNGTPTS